MTKKETFTPRSDRSKNQQIHVQDFYNSTACIADEDLKERIRSGIEVLVQDVYDTVDAASPVRIWVDGSYNASTKKAGIGVVIITDPEKPFDQKNNICFGKPLSNIDSSVKAEIYALSIGLSYVMDRNKEIKNMHVYYDCVDSVACAANINSFAQFGSPYTNFRSALKRIRRNKINVAFEHTKAHGRDLYNEICDVTSKHFSGANMTPAQSKLWKHVRDEIMVQTRSQNNKERKKTHA